MAHCLRQLERSNGGQKSVRLAIKVLKKGLGDDTPAFQRVTHDFLKLIDESKDMEYDVFVGRVDEVVDRACDALLGVGAVPNFGDRIREGLRALIIMHWAPIGEPQAKGQSSNTISTKNGCVRVLVKNAPWSLHRAMNGEIEDDLKRDIEENVGFVDMCVCQLPKDDPMGKYSEIAGRLGVPVEMLDLFSLLNITAHAIAHEKKRGKPLPVIVASAESIKRFEHEGESKKSIRFCTFSCPRLSPLHAPTRSIAQNR